MSIHPVLIVKAETKQQKDACFALRREVFVAEQEFYDEDEIDADDKTCDHYLAMQGGELIGTARAIMQNDCAIIGRLAVRAAHRGKGTASLLMRRMLADIRARTPGMPVEVGAQVRVETFYKKFGFISYGELYDDTGVPHIHMRLNLARKSAS